MNVEVVQKIDAWVIFRESWAYLFSCGPAPRRAVLCWLSRLLMRHAWKSWFHSCRIDFAAYMVRVWVSGTSVPRVIRDIDIISIFSVAEQSMCIVVRLHVREVAWQFRSQVAYTRVMSMRAGEQRVVVVSISRTYMHIGAANITRRNGAL